MNKNILLTLAFISIIGVWRLAAEDFTPRTKPLWANAVLYDRVFGDELALSANFLSKQLDCVQRASERDGDVGVWITRFVLPAEFPESHFVVYVTPLKVHICATDSKQAKIACERLLQTWKSAVENDKKEPTKIAFVIIGKNGKVETINISP